jgi:hypothetical protein
MGIQWHQFNHKDLLEVSVAWQKPCYVVTCSVVMFDVVRVYIHSKLY